MQLLSHIRHTTRRRHLVLLGVLGCALAAGAPSTAKAAGYGFSVRTPYSARCVVQYNNAGSYKSISVMPPIVYAANSTSQWVTWRTVIWNAQTGQDLWYGAWQQAVATTTAPAQFAGNEGVTFSGNAANQQLVAETDVEWYSPGTGWHSMASVYAQRILVTGLYGSSIQTTC